MIHIVLATMINIPTNPNCLLKFRELEIQIQQTKQSAEDYCENPPTRRGMMVCEEVEHECAIEMN